MNPKEAFSCVICKKIQSEPVYLPCLCQSVCKEHIDKMIKSDQREYIKCNYCDEDFEIGANTEFLYKTLAIATRTLRKYLLSMK